MKSRFRKLICISAISLAFPAGVSGQQAPEGPIWGLNLFGGYQWTRMSGTLNPLGAWAVTGVTPGSRRFGDDPVAGIRFTQDFHKYIGVEEGFTYAFLPVTYTSFGAGNQAKLDARSYRVSANPVFHFTPRESKFRPFVTVGVAANWFDPNASTLVSTQPRSTDFPVGTDLKTKVEPVLFYGVGLKVNVSRRFGLRFDVRDNWSKTPHFNLQEYPSAVGDYYSPKGETLHQIEATAGIVFRWGYKEPPPAPAPVARAEAPAPPPPPSFSIDSLSANASEVCPGSAVEIRAAATGVPSDATYRWTVNGSPIDASGATASVSTTGKSGKQDVVLTVEAGGVTKTQTTSFTVKNAAPPTVTVGISPSTIQHGMQATITPTATGSECGGNVRTMCTASEGVVNGTTFDSSNVAFDPNAAKAQSKTVTITCTGTDSLGGTGSGTATVAVTERPKARRLDDLVFGKGSARVNNCAKRLLLEEVTALMRDNPDWTLVVVSHRDEQESGRAMAHLDRSRAMNTAAVLSAGTGICPSLDLSRVKVLEAGTTAGSEPKPSFCGASTTIKERTGQAVTAEDTRAQFRRVELWLIPSGADTPDALKSAQPIPADVVKRLGCPK
ncbi:MAG: hypothetical protein ABI693_16345 [Bryobacteraceae bacterium]